MKKFYKFLFYKLYRFAIAEEKSVSINLNFVVLSFCFEMLHLLIFGLVLKIYDIYFNLNAKLFSVLLLIISALFNYYYFIREKKIEKINLYFQEQKRIVWKDNLLFFGYIIMLFIIMFIQIFILKRLGKN
jgi:uncharacterized membrane protein